ncbi:MAG: hypothetical protein WBB07_28925 [Mycobacterium sp.]
MKSKTIGPEIVTYAAYVCVLLAFVCLGLLVAALALGTGGAAALGATLVTCLILAGAGFRAGARKLDNARAPGNPGSPSIWDKPLAPEQIAQYRRSYGAAHEETRSATSHESQIRPAATDQRAA